MLYICFLFLSSFLFSYNVLFIVMAGISWGFCLRLRGLSLRGKWGNTGLCFRPVKLSWGTLTGLILKEKKNGKETSQEYHGLEPDNQHQSV